MEPYLAALTEEITAAGRMVKERGPAHQILLHGRRHAHHPVRPSDGRAADPPEPQLRPVRTAWNTASRYGGPDTSDREKLQVLLDHGADRISVNPQSLEPQVLAAIGRKHSPEDIEQAMALATSMGFPHVNMDLIAGLPADTPEGFRRTLDRA